MRTSWLYICSLGLYFFPIPSRSKLDLRANCFAIACSALALDANAELLSDETLDAREGGFGFTREVEVDAWSSKDFGGARSAAVEEDDEAKAAFSSGLSFLRISVAFLLVIFGGNSTFLSSSSRLRLSSSSVRTWLEDKAALFFPFSSLEF